MFRQFVSKIKSTIENNKREILIRDAEQGDPNAQYELGRRHYEGLENFEKNYERAVEWFQKAEKQGNLSATCFLGRCYHCGNGVKQNTKEAIRRYNIVIEKGLDFPEVEKWLLIANAKLKREEEQLLKARVEEQQKAEAERLAEEKRKQAEAERLAEEKRKQEEAERLAEEKRKQAEAERLAEEKRKQAEAERLAEEKRKQEEAERLAEEKRKQEEALAWLINILRLHAEEKRKQEEEKNLLIRNAESGNASAQNNLGWNYYTGTNGFEKDVNKAIYLFKKAEEQQNLFAIANLGRCFQCGDGMAQDIYEAIRRYEQFAMIYPDNTFVQKWRTESYSILAERGDSDYQYKYGLCYQDGIGIEQNYSKAFEWFYQAAEQKHPLGCFNVGEYLRLGKGCVQDLSKAIDYYEKSVEFDDTLETSQKLLLQNKIADIYTNGTSTAKKDTRIAYEWYLLAAQRGNVDAMAQLGTIYLYGEGVDKDLFLALKWLKKYQEQGNSQAYDKEINQIKNEIALIGNQNDIALQQKIEWECSDIYQKLDNSLSYYRYVGILSLTKEEIPIPCHLGSQPDWVSEIIKYKSTQK